jgi:hypothetical protein
MKQSAQKIIKPVIAILWLFVDFGMFLAGLYDGMGDFKAIFAIILWIVVLWIILKVIERIDFD